MCCIIAVVFWETCLSLFVFGKRESWDTSYSSFFLAYTQTKRKRTLVQIDVCMQTTSQFMTGYSTNRWLSFGSSNFVVFAVLSVEDLEAAAWQDAPRRRHYWRRSKVAWTEMAPHAYALFLNKCSGVITQMLFNSHFNLFSLFSSEVFGWRKGYVFPCIYGLLLWFLSALCFLNCI